jgi:ferrous iron transport protein A
MLPISLSEPGKAVVIQRIGGTAEVRRHLETLGFTVGETVSLVSALNGSVIVKVKESRVAIGEDLARKIMV